MKNVDKKRRKKRGEDNRPQNYKVVVEFIYNPPQEFDPQLVEGYVVMNYSNKGATESAAWKL